MSNYHFPAINPKTQQTELDALWIDDYYGPHRYGVQFSDGEIYPAEYIALPDDPPLDAP